MDEGDNCDDKGLRNYSKLAFIDPSEKYSDSMQTETVFGDLEVRW
jgi:hypothetical protein